MGKKERAKEVAGDVLNCFTEEELRAELIARAGPTAVVDDPPDPRQVYLEAKAAAQRHICGWERTAHHPANYVRWAASQRRDDTPRAIVDRWVDHEYTGTPHRPERIGWRVRIPMSTGKNVQRHGLVPVVDGDVRGAMRTAMARADGALPTILDGGGRPTLTVDWGMHEDLARKGGR